MSEASGTTRGRKERECGAIGVSSAHGTEGATMGPPDDNEYAVEPEGVAIISPSACVQVTHILHSRKCHRLCHYTRRKSRGSPCLTGYALAQSLSQPGVFRCHGIHWDQQSLTTTKQPQDWRLTMRCMACYAADHHQDKGMTFDVVGGRAHPHSGDVVAIHIELQAYHGRR